ncbi:uncharacterized protein [Antedon mediterranea]|uniref:uncharacterized protein n=1 Tax=Antedon mediterranea TaxID=105859 RepID=UPI003AF65927
MAFRDQPGANRRNGFQIFVNNLQGQAIPFDVYPDTDVMGLKDMIFRRFGVAVGNQRLLYGGSQLNDGDTMEYLGIRMGMQATIHLVLRVHGG